MYTEQQAREAIGAKQIEELEKTYQLWVHKDAVREQTIYNLPYRILFDYFYNAFDRDIMEISLTPWYPLPMIPKVIEKELETISPVLPLADDDTENEKPCTNAPVISDSMIADIANKHGIRYGFDVTTEQGQQAFIYHLMVYILPYKDKIPGWTCFDMYGDTKHTTEELNERKQYYMDLIQRCIDNPELYNHDIPHKHIEDYDKYNVHECYMWFDDYDGTPPTTDKDTALAIMYKEREIQQRIYGEEYELETRDHYGVAHRIEEIIHVLETDTV